MGAQSARRRPMRENGNGHAAEPSVTAWTFSALTARLGWRWFLRGVEYGRCVEYVLAIRALGLCTGSRILAVGRASSSLLPTYLATQGKYSVYFTARGAYDYG